MILGLIMMFTVPCLLIVIGNAVFGKIFDREMERRMRDE